MGAKKGHLWGKTIILFAFLSLASLNCGKPDRSIISQIPQFKATTVKGTAFDSRKTNGKYSFFAFIDPRKTEDLDLCTTVRNREPDQLNIILVSQFPNIPSEILDAAGYQIILDSNLDIRRSFRIPSSGIYLLFDPRGKYLGGGRTSDGYDEGPKALLAWHLRGVRFERNLFVPGLDENISKLPWLSQLKKIIDSTSKRFYLLGFFSSICEGCSSGSTFRLLTKIRSEADDMLDVRAIISYKYEPIDIERIVSQLKANFPVVLADPLLSEKWARLDLNFRSSDINEIVFLVDSLGKVRLILDPVSESQRDKFFYDCLDTIRERR